MIKIQNHDSEERSNGQRATQNTYEKAIRHTMVLNLTKRMHDQNPYNKQDKH